MAHMGLVRPINLLCITRLDHRRSANIKEKVVKIPRGRKRLLLIHRCNEDTKKTLAKLEYKPLRTDARRKMESKMKELLEFA